MSLPERGQRIVIERFDPSKGRRIIPSCVAFRKLYTGCYLLKQGRGDDFQEYNQTGDPRFEEEAGILLKSYTIRGVAESISIEVSIPTSNDPKVLDIAQFLMRAAENQAT